MLQKSDINVNSEKFVISQIHTRKDELIIMNKKELQMADGTNSTLDFGSELCIILGSALLGYVLAATPTLTRSYICSILLTIILLVAGFYMKSQKQSFLEKVLKMYEEK